MTMWTPGGGAISLAEGIRSTQYPPSATKRSWNRNPFMGVSCFVVALEDATLIAASVSVLIAVVSAVVAALARRDARRSADAAERSAGAAEQLVEIERQRRHDDLAPKLRVKATRRTPGSDRICLTVTLAGPDGLDRLDQVVVRVLDDNRDHTPVTVGGPTDEQIAVTIWGPHRFVPGVDGADAFGRTVRAFPLVRGDSLPLEMEPTLVPSWVVDPTWWRQQYAEEPIRLEFTCVRAAEPPWRVLATERVTGASGPTEVLHTT